MTTVSRKTPLFLFRAVFLTDLEHHDVTLLQQWRQGCLAIEDRAKREEPEEINKDEGIKNAMEVQAPAVKEEDILQPLANLFTPTEIEAFKMIELARIQNKYLTQENILLKDHIVGLKGIIRKMEELLRSMCDYPSSSPPSSPAKDT